MDKQQYLGKWQKRASLHQAGNEDSERVELLTVVDVKSNNAIDIGGRTIPINELMKQYERLTEDANAANPYSALKPGEFDQTLVKKADPPEIVEDVSSVSEAANTEQVTELVGAQPMTRITVDNTPEANMLRNAILSAKTDSPKEISVSINITPEFDIDKIVKLADMMSVDNTITSGVLLEHIDISGEAIVAAVTEYIKALLTKPCAAE